MISAKKNIRDFEKLSAKYFLKYLLFLIMFQVILPSRVTGQSDSVEVTITSPNSIFVKIDDHLTGQTPLLVILPAGKHIVTAMNDFYEWNKITEADTLVLNGTESKITLNYDLSKKIIIKTDPADAQVMIGDSLIGNSPYYSREGNETVTLNKIGYKQIKLKPTEFADGKTIKLIPINGDIKKRQQFTDTPWFKILLGSAALLGAATAYYKLQADKKYDEYLLQKDPDLLEQTKRLDRAAGVGLTFLEINFGAMIYFILRDYL